MNKLPSPEADLEDRFGHLLPPAWGAHLVHGDHRVELRIPGAKVALQLIVRADPRLRDFPFGMDGLSSSCGLIPVLAAPRVSARLQERLREAGWGWLDGAGNAYLSIPGSIHLERSGHSPSRRMQNTVDLGSALALQVIRALLHPMHASQGWALRDLSRDSSAWDDGTKQIKEPSLGLLSKLVRQLVDDAYLKRASHKGPVRLVAPEALLKDAGKAYPGLRRVECFSILPKTALEKGLQGIELTSGGYAAWAAFSAADLIAPAVSQNTAWMMVAHRFQAKLMDALQAKGVDSGGNLMLLVPEDDAPFYLSESVGNRTRCTSAVQTYWDLLHAGGRGEEAAQAVLNRCLRPAWANANLG